MISIVINGKPQSVAETNLQTFLEQSSDFQGTFAIALNEQFVPRDNYSTTKLNDGDRLEVLSPMQGG